MYCQKCGAVMAEGMNFCTACGAELEAANVLAVQNAAGAEEVKKESYFDGGLMGLFGVNLLSAFLSGITFGFAWPAMYCFKKRWIYKHTVVGGYRLKFTGSGAQLFGKYILWTFLTVITCGIYGFWLPIRYRRWETKHIEIDSVVV